jgi:hypothetical protein
MPAGRPTSLTPAVQAKVVEALTKGNVREHAAQYAGVSRATFYNWLKRGRKETTGPFRDFLGAVEASEVSCAMRFLAIVDKAASERDEVTIKEITFPDGSTKTEKTTRRVFDWQAAIWWLERRFPEAWSKDAELIREIAAELKKRNKARG